MDFEMQQSESFSVSEGDDVKYITKDTDKKWIVPMLSEDKKNPVEQFVEGVPHKHLRDKRNKIQKANYFLQ